mgnify:CR=1 FL=1
MKINRDRLIQIIREELNDFSPEDESVLAQTKIREQIDELKASIEKLKLISQGEQTVATSVPHSADTESNIASSFMQSINIIEVEIAKLEADLSAERYSYQQYKE